MGQPAEDEMERSPRVAAKHLEDVVLHGKSMKAPGTYTNTVATAYYQHFMKWLKDYERGTKTSHEGERGGAQVQEGRSGEVMAGNDRSSTERTL